MEEIWKDMEFENYKISSKGRVKSLKGKKEKILKSCFDGDKYLRVGLYIDKKQVFKRINRLVAEYFIPNPENKSDVNHINGIKIDNEVENLEWCSHKENMNHAWNIGLMKNMKGEINGRSKLNENDILNIRSIHKDLSLYQLSVKYKVSRTVISNVRNYKSWKHIKNIN